MKTIFYVPLYLLGLSLTACNTMNSNFSCQVTAGDSCLTIEQVDAMTHFADELQPHPIRRGMMKAEIPLQQPLGNIIHQKDGQSVWVSKHLEGKAWA